MPYYLKHYFMPDFNHKRIRPVPMADGNTVAHYLGYVQNVVAGQIMAELIHLDSIPEGYRAQDHPEGSRAGRDNGPIPLKEDFPQQEAFAETFEEEEQGYWKFLQNLRKMDPRFIYNAPVFPLGPNCARDPQNPNRIVALANGYGFYHQGLITVKKLLNVRQDVDFHTGNITFVGDIVVHGDVHPGFSLTGTSILVKGGINGGAIRARGNIVAESGIKGSPEAHVRSGLTVRIASCERATIVTRGNLIVDGNVLHSDLFVGGSLVINGRLQGGDAYAAGLVFVKGQIGNAQGAPTRISLGYDPLALPRLQKIKVMEQEQEQKLAALAKMAHKSPRIAADVAPAQELATRKGKILEKMYGEGWRAFTANVANLDRARVIVPGSVYPGVNITIGRAGHKVIDEQNNVFYALHEEEIVYGFPAVSQNRQARIAGMETHD